MGQICPPGEVFDICYFTGKSEITPLTQYCIVSIPCLPTSPALTTVPPCLVKPAEKGKSSSISSLIQFILTVSTLLTTSPGTFGPQGERRTQFSFSPQKDRFTFQVPAATLSITDL